MVEVPALKLKKMLADGSQCVAMVNVHGYLQSADVSDRGDIVFENGTTVRGIYVWTNIRVLIRTFIWKIVFIKNNMTGYINFTCCKIKTFIAMMVQAITNKNTVFRFEIDFMFVIWSKIRPACNQKL